MNPAITNLSAHQLRRAAELKERIDELQAELNLLLGGSAPTGGNGTARKRQISAAGIARIRAAQKARWAKARQAAGPAPRAAKKKRHMPAAAKARLAEIARARWKAAKAQGKSAL